MSGKIYKVGTCKRCHRPLFSRQWNGRLRDQCVDDPDCKEVAMMLDRDASKKLENEDEKYRKILKEDAA